MYNTFIHNVQYIIYNTIAQYNCSLYWDFMNGRNRVLFITASPFSSTGFAHHRHEVHFVNEQINKWKSNSNWESLEGRSEESRNGEWEQFLAGSWPITCRDQLNLRERGKVTVKVKVLVTQLCSTLCKPMDCSPPGSSVYEILQAGILEWVVIPFSSGSSWPRIKPGSLLQAESLPSSRGWIYWRGKNER